VGSRQWAVGSGQWVVGTGNWLGLGFSRQSPLPLGGEGGPQPAPSPAGAGRVRGSPFPALSRALVPRGLPEQA